jgi:hypothetical protein
VRLGDVLTDKNGKLFKITEMPYYDTLVSISGTVTCLSTGNKYKFNPKGYVYILETYLLPYTGGKVLSFEKKKHEHNRSPVSRQGDDPSGAS